jgi:hypothetical protein
VRHDPPDGVERGLDRALRPPRHEGNVVAGQEDAPLGRRQPVLHEVPVHAVVVPVVAGQRPLEGAEEVRVIFPGDRHRVAHDVARDVDAGVDLAERVKRELDALFDVVRQHLQRVGHPRVGQADDRRPVRAVVE